MDTEGSARDEITDAYGPDWRRVGGVATAWFEAPSLSAAAALAVRLADAAGSGPLPAIDLRPDGVRIRLGTAGSRPPEDRATAEEVSAAAHALGLAADPAALQQLGVRIAAHDPTGLLPFWQTVLDYQEAAEPAPGDPVRLLDPAHREPPLQLTRLTESRPLRNRLHLDASGPHLRSTDAAAAAGGHSARPSQGYGAFADAEGNEVDLVPDFPVGDDPGLSDWRAAFAGMTRYPADAGRAAELAATVAAAADQAGCALLIDLRADGVLIDTGKDRWEEPGFADLGRQVQTVAAELGLTAATDRLRFVQLGIDAVDVPAIRAFWCTALGYLADERPGLTDIYHPRRLDPPFILQPMPAEEVDRRQQRGRIQLELALPADQVAHRIDTIIGAGGRAVDEHRPGARTIADPEGNEVVIMVG